MNIEKTRARIRTLLIAVFFILLWLPLLDTFTGLDRAPEPNEKRRLAQFPSLPGSVSGTREFLSGLEAYYSDHFGFRKRLIKLNQKWKRKWFNDSSFADVIEGRNGWYFFIGDEMINHYSGTRRFSSQELDDWRLLLETRRDWLARRGIKYMFVVPPDKHSVYPEFLPEWMIKSPGPSKLDQFFNCMKTRSSVEVVDLRPALIEGKRKAQTYLFTDTHWNYFGAFLGYRALMEALGRQMTGLQPLAQTAFDWKPREDSKGGDLAILLGRDNELIEKGHCAITPLPPAVSIEPTIDPARLRKNWLAKTEPAITLNTNARGKAIVFRDSFAGAWAPFLGNHFREVIYIWQYEWDASFIEREKPDVVIDEILERFFNRKDPKELLRQDQLK